MGNCAIKKFKYIKFEKEQFILLSNNKIKITIGIKPIKNNINSFFKQSIKINNEIESHSLISCGSSHTELIYSFDNNIYFILFRKNNQIYCNIKTPYINICENITHFIYKKFDYHSMEFDKIHDFIAK
jgi:hypothetical protein